MTQPAQKFPPPIGNMPTLQFLLLDQLEVDETYQRSIDNPGSQSMIRAIARSWNWDLCQPLFVARRNDGRMYVVDGQHRLAAARERGDIAQLPCIIALTDGVSKEAKLFSEFNRRRRPPSALDLYFSDLAAGDPVAADIDVALKAAGLRMAKSSNTQAMKAGAVINVAGMRRVHSVHGQDVLAFALLTMARAWPGQVLQYAGTIFPGIAEIVRHERALAKRAPRWTESARVQAIAGVIGRKAQMDWYGLIQRRKGDQPGTSLVLVAEQVMLEHWTKANP